MRNPAFLSEEDMTSNYVRSQHGHNYGRLGRPEPQAFRGDGQFSPFPPGGQIPLQIQRDKNWARKSFLLSGDLIFPGMRGMVDGDRRGGGGGNAGWDFSLVGSQVRTSVFMQMVLHASGLAFLVWIGLYLLSIQTMMELLKEIHARIYCIVFAVFIVTNTVRLYVGTSGNKTDTTNMVSTYCVITLVLQALPLAFLLSSNIWVSDPCYHLISADIVLLIHLVLEVVATFHRLSLLLADEVEIIRLEETVKKAKN